MVKNETNMMEIMKQTKYILTTRHESRFNI